MKASGKEQVKNKPAHAKWIKLIEGKSLNKKIAFFLAAVVCWTFRIIIYSVRNWFGLELGTLRWTLKVLSKAKIYTHFLSFCFPQRSNIKSRANLLLAIYRKIDFTKLALNDFPAVTRFSLPPSFCQFIYLSELVRVMCPKIYVFNKNEYQDYYEKWHAQIWVMGIA